VSTFNLQIQQGTRRALGLIGLLLALVLVVSGCQTVGTVDDSAAAQQFLPNVAGFDVSNADSIVDALTAAGAGGALASGNVPAAVAIERADTVLQCLQDTGSLTARMYVEAQPRGIVPEAGAVMVANTTRVNQNLLACLTQGRPQGDFSTQSITLEPCVGSGEFVFQSDNFSFIYVGVGNSICTAYDTHFGSLQGTN